MKKKVVFTAIVTVLLLSAISLTACGGTGEEVEPTQPAQQEQEQDVVTNGQNNAITVESTGNAWADEQIVNFIALAQKYDGGHGIFEFQQSFYSVATDEFGILLDVDRIYINLTKADRVEFLEWRFDPEQLTGGRAFGGEYEITVDEHDDGFIRKVSVYSNHEEFGEEKSVAIGFGQYVFTVIGDKPASVDALVDELGYLAMSEVSETPFADLRDTVISMDSSIGEIDIANSSFLARFSIFDDSIENSHARTAEIRAFGSEEGATESFDILVANAQSEWSEIEEYEYSIDKDFSYIWTLEAMQMVFGGETTFEEWYTVTIVDRNIMISARGEAISREFMKRFITELGYEL